MGIGKKTDNIFSLVHYFGSEEDQISACFAFILGQNRRFRRRILGTEFRLPESLVDRRGIEIETQVHYPEENSVIDVEVALPGRFHVVVESKIWENQPSVDQLVKYARFLRSRQVDEVEDQIRLVLITQSEDDSRFEQAVAEVLRLGLMARRDLVHLRWKDVLDIFKETREAGSRKALNDLFARYLEDKMGDRKIISEQKVADLREVLVQATDEDWWDFLLKRNLICNDNNTPDALYIAVYRTHPHCAITHVARVKESRRNVPWRESYKGFPNILRKGKERGWPTETHKEFLVEEPVPLPHPIIKPPGPRGIRNKVFTTLAKLLAAKTLADL